MPDASWHPIRGHVGNKPRVRHLLTIMEPEPEFSVIIVTFNSRSHILPCVESVMRQGAEHRFEIIVVDNNSTDATVPTVQAMKAPRLRLLRNNENVGFSAACNMGAHVSAGKYVYFCNPDTMVVSDIFSGARRAFEDNSVGCFSPKILWPDGTDAPFAFRFPRLPFSLTRALFKNLTGRSGAKALQIQSEATSQPFECDWVMGASMLIPRHVFFEVGGFDEGFFLYYEDVDLCKRIKAAGYKIVADRNCQIIHEKYASVRSLPKSRVIKIRLASEVRYYRKYHAGENRLLKMLGLIPNFKQ